MSDRHDFLAAIRAAPDEDAPRLIYADWLDDHGEGERAALIRFQVAEIADDPVKVTAPGDREGRRSEPRPRCDVLALARRVGIELGSLTADDLLGFRRGFLAGFRYPYNPKVPALRRILADEPMDECHIAVAARSLNDSIAGIGRELVDGVRCVAVKLRREIELELGDLPNCREFRAAGRGRVYVALPTVQKLVIEAAGNWEVNDRPGQSEMSGAGFRRVWRACARRPRHLDVTFGDRLRPEHLPSCRGLRSLALRNIREQEILGAIDRYANSPFVSLTIEVDRRELGGYLERVVPPLADWLPAAGLRALHYDHDPWGDPIHPLTEAARNLERLRCVAVTPERGWPAGLGELDVRLVRYPGMADVPQAGWRSPLGLSRLRMRNAYAGDIRRLCEGGGPPGLDALRLDGHDGDPPPGLTADDVSALANSAFGPNLQALTLGRVADPTVRRAAFELFGPRCDVYWQTGNEGRR